MGQRLYNYVRLNIDWMFQLQEDGWETLDGNVKVSEQLY